MVYPIGKNLFKTVCSNRSHSNHSVLDPGQVPEIKGVTRSESSSVLSSVVDFMGVDFPLRSKSVVPPKYPR